MDATLDDIAFLANSENRVSVFETLVEAPRSRGELLELVDASRVTIARILREFEERDWIERSGQEYAVTPLGEWVCGEFARLVDEFEAERRLRDPLQWLPSDLLTFDVRHLRDAELVRLDETDTTAVVRRTVEFYHSGERVRGLSRCIAPVLVENLWELTVQGDTRVEQVLTPEAMNVVRNHPTSAQQFREMLDQENARCLVSEDVPVSMGIVDGAVAINLTDDQGVQKGGLITDDETVHGWAVDVFETCREEARPVEPDAITA